MRLLFLSYWGLNDGLTAATVLPHLKIISSFDHIEEIVFCTIERGSIEENSNIGLSKKIKYFPLISESRGNVFLTKTRDFILFPKQLTALCKKHRIDKIICRSSMAGALGYLVSKKTNIPFSVESFEPHAESMIESDVWTKYDPRFWIELFFEKQQVKKARKIFPVSHHHKNRLIQEGVPESKITVMPCCVSLDNFKFDKSKRTRTRETLHINEKCIVGIYVGKFGGIYYDDEAFDLYKQAFDFFGSGFWLIILTEQDQNHIVNSLNKRSIDKSRVFITKAKHDEVNAYLSASDFAFSTIKPVPSRLYCSPIKNGEYWANGLPILTELNIGDDSDIIKNEGGGILLDKNNLSHSFDQMRQLVKMGREHNADVIRKIALKHRSMELVETIYRREFSEV